MNVPPPFAPVALPGNLPGETADRDLQDMVTNDVVVEKYVALRNKKKEIAERHKQEMAPFNDAMEQLEIFMLDRLNRTGTESVRTAMGTAFKVTQTSYKVEDPGTLRPWLEANDAGDLLETRISKTALNDWLDAGKPLPPGVGVSQFVQVQFRTA